MKSLAEARQNEALMQARQLYYIKRNIVKEKSLSFDYIKYRLFRPVLKQYDKLLKIRRNTIPWLSPAAIRILDHLLTPHMTGLEYGSGKSTLYFSSRVKELHSIEHFELWYNLVKESLEKQNIRNVNYQLIKPSMQATSKTERDYCMNKFDNRSFPKVNKEEIFKDYIKFINSFADEYFDFILIDGRARECILPLAISKLKQGGFLILDNSDRKRYHKSTGLLYNWPKVITSSGLTDTTFWFKP